MESSVNIHLKTNHIQKRQKRQSKFLSKFFLKLCQNLTFLGPTNGRPHKSIFQVNISCLLGRILQLLATLMWQLTNMEPVCTICFCSAVFPLGKADPFQVWCYRPLLGLANIEPVYIGAKIFEYIPGMETHVNIHLKENHIQKRQKRQSKFLSKFF